jgi:hypothetical protein
MTVLCACAVSCAAGDGSGGVRRLEFDPLWRSYTWGRPLPPASPHRCGLR